MPKGDGRDEKILPYCNSLFLLAPSAVQADQIKMTMMLTGNDLLSICTADTKSPVFMSSFGHCQGYVLGAFDMLATMRAERKLSSCLRNGVTKTQMVDTVVQLIKDHPATRDQPASYFIIKALPQFFTDCP